MISTVNLLSWWSLQNPSLRSQSVAIAFDSRIGWYDEKKARELHLLYHCESFHWSFFSQSFLHQTPCLQLVVVSWHTSGTWDSQAFSIAMMQAALWMWVPQDEPMPKGNNIPRHNPLWISMHIYNTYNHARVFSSSPSSPLSENEASKMTMKKTHLLFVSKMMMVTSDFSHHHHHAHCHWHWHSHWIRHIWHRHMLSRAHRLT